MTDKRKMRIREVASKLGVSRRSAANVLRAARASASHHDAGGHHDAAALTTVTAAPVRVESPSTMRPEREHLGWGMGLDGRRYFFYFYGDGDGMAAITVAAPPPASRMDEVCRVAAKNAAEALVKLKEWWAADGRAPLQLRGCCVRCGAELRFEPFIGERRYWAPVGASLFVCPDCDEARRASCEGTG